MRVLKGIGKVILAGVTAITILSLILCLYNLTPVHHDNPKGNTDYVWPPNSVWVKLTEGIAWGRYDADGFNNPKVIENPDIIILGSSHMEASEIFYKQTVCAILTDKLEDKYSVYNLGVSGHNFYKVCQYLPMNLVMHDTPPKIAIIETSIVNLSEDRVSQVLNSSVPRSSSHASGLIGTLQRIPFFRNVYHQYAAGLLNIFMAGENMVVSGDEDFEKTDSVDSTKIDDLTYNKLFEYLSNLEDKYGTQIIIFYHPTEQLTEDGGILFKSSAALNAFGKYAEANGIDFIDMTTAFENMYYEKHLVAHGFVTGELCKGHLNANGHAAVAEELYKAITNMEKEGVLCK